MIMKKLAIILFSVVLSLPVYSQDDWDIDLKNKFYVRVGLATPTWTYFGYKNEAALKAGLDAESRIGGILEIGKIYMLNSIDLGKGLRFGINADFISIKSHVFNLSGSDNLYSGFAGSKIGPSFTIAINKAIAFDVFAKINPVWAAAVYENNQSIITGINDIDVYYGYVQMMYSFGLNVKLAFIMLGIEYDLGSLKLKNSDGEYWDPTMPDWDPELNPQMTTSKIPMNGFNITIGVTF